MDYSLGAAYQFVSERFGGPCREEENTITAGVSALQCAPRDPERVFIVWVNLSANAIYISPFPTVSASRGIRLAASGGLVTFDVREDAILPALEWWCLAAGAGSTLYRLAVRRETAVGEPKVPRVG